MQAEHIPVHLGAMPERGGGRARRGARARGTPGSSTIPTAAARTFRTSPLISPVFAGGELVGFAANRAHHADVGGKLPGSMPADSHTLDDEGVVIPPSRLVREGRLDEELLGRSQRPNAQPRPAASRPARPARRRPCGRLRVDGAGGALRARHAARGDGRDARLRGAPHARAHRASWTTACARPRDVLEARGRRPGAAAARRGGGRRAAARLQRLGGRSTTATSTARWRSRCRPATSRCACSPTPTCRPARAPTGR